MMVSLVLTMVLVVGLAMPVMASSSEPSDSRVKSQVSVVVPSGKADIANHKYVAYQIFKGNNQDGKT